jgi:DNA-binding MarR family transcriptional regulator
VSTRTRPHGESQEPTAPQVREVAGAHAPQTEEDRFDRLVYGRVRLGIMSALAVNDLLTFNDLKALFAVTDGNLGAHARKLEDAGFISCRKTFEERRSRTEYRLTPVGRKALERYLQHIEAVIRATRRA